MLLPRLLTAIVLIAFAILVIFYLPSLGFFILSAVFLAWLAWEWAAITAIKQIKYKIGLVMLYLLAYLAAVRVPIGLLLMLATIWWLAALIILIIYPKGKHVWFDNKFISTPIGMVIIIPTGVALNLLHSSFEPGPVVLLYALALVWIADSAAYFSGRLFGKHKLAPSISPKKTLEGLAGGMLFSLIYAAIFGYYLQFSSERLLVFVGFSMIAALISVVGDLFISLFKRCAGLKDSGRFLPGHGGIFDRLDGVCAAIPVFTLALLMMVLW